MGNSDFCVFNAVTAFSSGLHDSDAWSKVSVEDLSNYVPARSLNFGIKFNLLPLSAFENERLTYSLLKQRDLKLSSRITLFFSNPCSWTFSLQEKLLISEFDNMTFLFVAQKYPCDVYESLYSAKMRRGIDLERPSRRSGDWEIEISLKDFLSVGKFLLISNDFGNVALLVWIGATIITPVEGENLIPNRDGWVANFGRHGE